MKEIYRRFCEEEASIPLFSQAWWLDATAGDNWQVALIQKGDNVVAAMPYTLKKRYGFTVLSQPSLTQTLGPWISTTNAKYAKRLGREKDLMTELIERLPDYDHFSQNWHFECTNWLPFHWQGFRQTTRYTYRIERLKEKSDQDIWADLQPNVRTDIKKARNRERLVVRDDLPLEVFWRLNKMVFERQSKPMPYGRPLIESLDKAAATRGCRKALIAVDEQGRAHAGVYVVWDEQSAYYLMGGGDPDLRNSGATSLCMWEAIKFASTVTSCFDFEGSMLEPVERFFRAFGAVQTPYFNLTHTPSRLFRGIQGVRDAIG